MSHYDEQYTNKISGGSYAEENKGVVFSGGGGASYTPPDPVNNPKHYTGHPSGIECIHVIEHMSFNLGNALKYIWRCDLKKDAIEDLKKARWYIDRELAKREKQ